MSSVVVWNPCNADAGPDQVICLQSNLPFCILRDVIHPLPGTHWDQKDRCSLALDRGSGHLPSTIYVLHVDLLWNRKLLLRYRYSLYHNGPLPVLHWTTVIPDVCSNAAQFWDTANILFGWIIPGFLFPNAGEQAYYRTQCEWNYFYPSVPGTYTITYYYTDAMDVPHR